MRDRKSLGMNNHSDDKEEDGGLGGEHFFGVVVDLVEERGET